jgi:hypothetical protein
MHPRKLAKISAPLIIIVVSLSAGIFDETGAVVANGFMDTLATQPRDVQFGLKVIW